MATRGDNGAARGARSLPDSRGQLAEGLQLTGLVWQAGATYCLDTELLRVRSGQVCVIDATPTAAAVQPGRPPAASPGGQLADVLLGLAPPVRGTVMVGGVPVTAKPPGQRSIALVPAGGGLLPHLTVERNIAFALTGTLTRQAGRAKVRGVLTDLEPESLRRFRPHEISPLQRLQVAVARARCSLSPTRAVVIEDRQGEISCRVAVRAAARHGLAVLVVADTHDRAESIEADLRHAVRLGSG